MPKRYSTKRLTTLVAPSPTSAGRGIFEFTDDYSVFHYGKLPDRIPGKGEAIARMAAFNFGLLADAGVQTHFLSFQSPNRIEFQLLRPLDPSADDIEPGTGYYMIPLQVIFRNSLPPGASVFRRLESGSVTLEQLGLTAIPEPGAPLERPLIEFTTKREEIDRFIGEDEARRIAGLTDREVEAIRRLTVEIDEIITARAGELGLDHADGKLEFGMLAPGEVVLVDAVGTPDENRFLLDGEHVGKQVMRDHYLAHGLEREVQEWVAAGRPRSTWPEPSPLPPGFLGPLSEMYRALAEQWTGTRTWGAPPLAEVMQTIRLLDSDAVRW